MKKKSTKGFFLFWGSLLTAGGLLIFYISAYLPLQQAREHLSEIDYSIKGIIIAPFIFMFGIASLGAGIFVSEEKLNEPEPTASTQPPKKRSPLISFLLILGGIIFFFGPPLAIFLWFKNEMESLGYSRDSCLVSFVYSIALSKCSDLNLFFVAPHSLFSCFFHQVKAEIFPS